MINEGLQKLRRDSQCTGSAVLNDDSFWMEDFDACSRQPVWSHRIVVWEKQKPDGEQGSLNFGEWETENKAKIQSWSIPKREKKEEPGSCGLKKSFAFG